MTSGWLFDIYPLDNKMVFWIKQEENGKTIRLEDNSWSHSIYVASECNSYLKSIVDIMERNDGNDSISSLVRDYEFTSRYERITDVTKSNVLKLTLVDSTKALNLARRIETLESSKFGKYRLYNVDLLPAQSYFYEHDIFPLAFCEVHNNSSKLRWLNKDSIWSTNYKIPDFKTIHLTVSLRKEGKIPRYRDKIDSITIKQKQRNSETIDIKCHDYSECDIIKQLELQVFPLVFLLKALIFFHHILNLSHLKLVQLN